jgi:succinate dehydrogenase hydrophobic anchor subunit
MKTLSIRFILITWGTAFLIWGSGEYLLWRHPDFISKVLEQPTVIYSVMAAVTVIFWHGINRLNSLDDLDNLKDSHRVVVRNKVGYLRSLLHDRVRSLVLATMMLFLLSSARHTYPILDAALKQQLVLMFAVLWFYGATYPGIFNAIEQLRQKVSDMRRKEKARQQLIAELRKDRQEQPLSSDEHLEKYKNVFSVNS